MGKDTSPPAAPDPNQVASSQAKYDQNTAAFNAGLNRYNVTTPYGNLTWNQTPGQKTFDQSRYDQALNAWQQSQKSGGQYVAPVGYDTSSQNPGGIGYRPYYGVNPDGSYNYTPPASSSPQPDRNDPQFWDTTGPPSYSQQITLNPTAQSTLDMTQGNALNLAKTQGVLLNNARNGLSSPLDMSALPGMGDKARQAAYDSSMALVQPQMDIQRNLTQTDLANKGIPVGSEGYNNEMGSLDRQQDWTRLNAANSAFLTGGQYENNLFNQALALRNQPLNEYNAMMTGTQVQAPQFQPSPPIMAGAPNYQSAVGQQYQGQLNAYNAQVGSQNSMNQGLMSLAALALLA